MKCQANWDLNGIGELLLLDSERCLVRTKKIINRRFVILNQLNQLDRRKNLAIISIL